MAVPEDVLVRLLVGAVAGHHRLNPAQIYSSSFSELVPLQEKLDQMKFSCFLFREVRDEEKLFQAVAQICLGPELFAFLVMVVQIDLADQYTLFSLVKAVQMDHLPQE